MNKTQDILKKSVQSVQNRVDAASSNIKLKLTLQF